MFVVIVTALVLGQDLDREAVGRKFYDWALFFSWLALVPIGFIVTVVAKLRIIKNVVYGEDAGCRG